MAAAPKKAKKQTALGYLKSTGQSVKGFNLNYFTAMPKQNIRRILAWIGVPLLFIVIALQLLYPHDRGLPLASIAGRSMNLASHDEMAKAIIDQFDKTKVKLAVGSDKSVEFSLKSAGAEPNTESMVDFLSEYPLWQRFIPGSILWQSGKLSTVDVYYAGKPFEQFVEARSKELSFAPQNARLAIKDGRLEATGAVQGSQVKSKDLLQVISRASIALGRTTKIDAPAKRLPATRTAKDLVKVRLQAEAALAHSVILKVDSQTFSPNKTELASWIVLATDDKGNVSLSIDKEKIKGYLTDLNNKVGIPAGQTNISIVDGREMGRTSGAVGRAIAVDVLADQLASSMLVPPPTITATAQFVEVQPSIIFNNKYTATQAGLQAYIDDIARSRNMYISIQQLDGGWSVGARANESIPSGSTYKLFVALVLFDRIDKGEIHWGDPMLDTTVAGCFERMTVASTNPCAEKWIAEFGRQYINDFIYARGFSGGTSFMTGSANQTTANDLTKFMIGLNNGTLVGGSNRDRLLDSLGRHPYRYGIPTGSRGAVNDKVGFLWDYIHDTAIVRHPRGTYIMTIMTKGQSYGAIASVTREIERIMYP